MTKKLLTKAKILKQFPRKFPGTDSNKLDIKEVFGKAGHYLTPKIAQNIIKTGGKFWAYNLQYKPDSFKSFSKSLQQLVFVGFVTEDSMLDDIFRKDSDILLRDNENFEFMAYYCNTIGQKNQYTANFGTGSGCDSIVVFYEM